MADLALILQLHVDRPILEQTGLKGRYDFKLQWTLDDHADPCPRTRLRVYSPPSRTRSG